MVTMPPRKSRRDPSERSAQLGLERMLFFSDAVMAIAITLLVIDLRLPQLPPASAAAQLPAQFAALTPRIMSFVISFAVIGVYWSSHHRDFAYVTCYDGRLVLLNLVFLFFMVLMPFAASMLGQYGFLPLGTIVYGLAVAASGFSIGAMWCYATHNHRLVDPGLDPAFIRHRNAVALAVPLIFLLSLPFALLSPLIAQAMWWIGPFAAVLLSRRPVDQPVGSSKPHLPRRA